MREILESKTLEEIKFLEKKVMGEDPKKEEHEAESNRDHEHEVNQINFHTGPKGNSITVHNLNYRNRNTQINIVHSEGTFGDKRSYGVSSPSDAGIILGTKYNFKESIGAPIQEALNERSELDDGGQLTQKDFNSSSHNLSLKHNNKSASSDKDVQSDRTTLIK